jgi:hypothetical protein
MLDMPPSLLSVSAALLTVLCTLVAPGVAAPRYWRHPFGQNPPVDLTRYHVPLSNGMAESAGRPLQLTRPGNASLPSPSTFRLQAITLGRGTQNYTCADQSATTIPVAVGAVAELFDVTPLLCIFPGKEAIGFLDSLPPILLGYTDAQIESFRLPVAGQHFFDGTGAPVFHVVTADGSTGVLVGAKTGDIAAPPGASPGLNGVGNGAVDWLQLTAKTGSSKLGLAYRVVTAGGKRTDTCEGMGAHFEVQYAAQVGSFPGWRTALANDGFSTGSTAHSKSSMDGVFVSISPS